MLYDITPDLLRDLERWLRSRRGVLNNTIHVYMRTIRAACNRAIRSGIMPAHWYPFRDYRISHLASEVRPRAMAIEHIRRIESWPPELATDLFLFSFYLRGIPLIDIAYLTTANIQAGRLIYNRRKTGAAYSIAISDKAKAILERYAGAAYLLPVLTGAEANERRQRERIHRVMVKVNMRLREVAKALGIETRVSFYSARHSYAMGLKAAGVASDVISEALGHSDIRTTKAYLRRFDESVIDSADRLLD